MSPCQAIQKGCVFNFKYGVWMNTFCHTVCCMLHTSPQKGVRFLAESNHRRSHWGSRGTWPPTFLAHFVSFCFWKEVSQKNIVVCKRFVPKVWAGYATESNKWNVNRTPNLKTVGKMLKVLSQVASDNVLVQPSVLFSVELLRTKF